VLLFLAQRSPLLPLSENSHSRCHLTVGESETCISFIFPSSLGTTRTSARRDKPGPYFVGGHGVCPVCPGGGQSGHVPFVPFVHHFLSFLFPHIPAGRAYFSCLIQVINGPLEALPAGVGRCLWIGAGRVDQVETRPPLLDPNPLLARRDY